MKIKTFREISEAIEYIKKVLKTDEVQKYQIIFCSDEYLLDINKQHLNHNYFTDIILNFKKNK
jgi:ssRNA-specific RNase YbeY (16S rRNA maturation enzyme)